MIYSNYERERYQVNGYDLSIVIKALKTKAYECIAMAIVNNRTLANKTNFYLEKQEKKSPTDNTVKYDLKKTL